MNRKKLNSFRILWAFLLLTTMAMRLPAANYDAQIGKLRYTFRHGRAEVVGLADKKLQAVEIPSSVYYQNEGRFYFVTSIGRRAFAGCHELANVKMAGTVSQIGDGAFRHCRNLTTVQLPDTITSIGNRAFEGCKHLRRIRLPKALIHIGMQAFKECLVLDAVTCAMPKPNVVNVGEGAFDADAYQRATIYVPAGTATAYKAMTGFHFKHVEEVEHIESDGTEEE